MATLSKARGAESAPPRLDIRGPVVLGLAAILIFIGGGLVGAAHAPIDKGAAMTGTIIVESKTRAVQHDRGGIVGAVHAQIGAEIGAGDLIVTLDTSSLDQQATALKAQRTATGRQLDLVREEIALLADLVRRQLTPRPRLMALERQVADLEKETASLAARIALIDQDRQRTEVRAPVAGRILSLAVHGRGAVIQAGATIAEIVPQNERLVIEGRLSPALIDLVKPGMPAKVWLAGYAWRDSHPLTARLAWISPDSVEDRRTGLTHFLARIELTQTRDEISRRMALHPGQRAEILVVTGARTLLDQLIDPIMRNINRSFRL